MSVLYENHRKFNFGDSYLDPAVSLRFVAYNPVLFEDKWRLYVAGLDASYKNHAVSAAAATEILSNKADTSVFFLAEDAQGNVMGGIRFIGPLKDATLSTTRQEMQLSPELPDLIRAIEGHLEEGIIEIKGLWAKGASITGASLAAALIRTVRPAMDLAGTHHAYASYAKHIADSVDTCGGQDFYLCPVPYPDERYSTVGIHFSKDSIVENSSPTARPSYTAQDTPDAPSQELLDQIYRPLVLDADADLSFLSPTTHHTDHLAPQQDQLREVYDLPDSVLNEPTRLVYYPWAHTVVKLLGPRAFAALRLERNRNKITRPEQARLRARSVAIIGASAGHAIAYTIAQEGLAGSLRIADFDDVELSNLNRIPASVSDLGLNKSVVLSRRIAELDPYLCVELFPDGVDENSIAGFLHGIDIVVEECDSLDIKVLVREHAKRLHIPVLMETSDRGTLDVERYDLEPDRPLFHGRLGGVASSDLKGLSLADRGPYVIRIMGTDTMSPRTLASLLEIDHTLGGWPQLGGDIALGAATMAAALRRLGSSDDIRSGRVQIDIDSQLDLLSEAPYDPSFLEGLALPAPTDPEDPTLSAPHQVADAARRAPSGGNIQAWRFELSSHALDVFTRPERSTNAMDIKYRGTYVAAGAALLNARARASELGILGHVTSFPEGLSSKKVATLSFGNSSDPGLSSLSAYINARVTNRRRPHPGKRPIDQATLHDLDGAAGAEGVTLRLITDEDVLSSLATQIAEADQLRFLLPEVHGAMMEELSWPGRDPLTSGLDVRTLEMDLATLSSFAVMARPDVMGELSSWKAGAALASNTYKAISASSALAILSVTRDGPRGYLKGGQGLERLWLEATKAALCVQPTVPLFLYADSEEDLLSLGGSRHVDDLGRRQKRFLDEIDIADTEVPIMVMRLFYADPPSVRSIKHPLSIVLATP
jgi:molybdopterin/thiamine biosynthesis adenylyltransferase